MISQRQDEPSTTMLVRSCTHGDAGAWAMLVKRFARLVHAVPVRHGLTPQEVDDVGQEVFLALAQNLGEIDDPERLPGWLVTTARRATWRALNRRRQEQSLDDHAQDENDDNPVAALVSSAPTPDDLLVVWGRQEALAQGMERLQTRCRELLSLLFLDASEPGYDEISAQLGLPKGSIGPTRIRCLQQLRAIMQGLGVATAE